MTSVRQPRHLDRKLTGTFDGFSMALLGLHACVYKETSCALRLTLIKRIPIRKGFLRIHALMRIFSAKKRMSTLHYYKNLKALTNRDTHNFSSSGTLELWKFSNLTFGGYLADTTLVLSTRSSLLLFCKCCLEHVRIVWLTDNFRHYHVVFSRRHLSSHQNPTFTFHCN